MIEDPALNEKLDRFQKIALIVGVAGLVLLLLGLLFSPAGYFFQAYLFGYILWTSLTVGCIALTMVHYLFGGAWGAVILRPLEAGTRVLPLMIVLFIPVLLGMHYTYIWSDPAFLARPENAQINHVVSEKLAYLNIPFFIIRAAIYFGIWSVLAFFLNRWSLRLDRTDDPAVTLWLKRISGIGMVLLVLSATFAAFDWLMSLTPLWYSGVYGAMVGVGWVVEAMAFATVLMALLIRWRPLSGILTSKMFGDFGNILLTLIMLWAYLHLSQLIIIWSANLPEETPWYLNRVTGGWVYVTVALALFHFGLPFLLLLSRAIRYNPRSLVWVAAMLLVMRVVNDYWLIIPAFGRPGFPLHWQEVVAPVGIGGLWLAYFIWQLKNRPLIPVNDPNLREALEHAQPA